MEPSRRLLATLICSPDSKFSEDEIALLWRYFVPRLEDVKTLDGLRLKVLDPGEVNIFSGPDISGVKLRMDGRIRRGDVEIHRQAADWYRHAHHQDPEFNSVILHLCLRASPECPARRQDGRFISAVRLAGYLPELDGLLNAKLGPDFMRRRQLVKHPCYLRAGDKDSARFHKHLRRAAFCWLFKRTAELEKLPAERRLFQIFTEALGYTANDRQFNRLARKLKLNRYHRVVCSKMSRLRREAWLLGVGGWLAGKLPSGSNSSIYKRRRVWRDFWSTNRPLVSKTCWVKKGVRPHSYPFRRWLAFGTAYRRISGRWQRWLIRRKRYLSGDDFRGKFLNEISELFVINAGSYWQHHYTFTDEYRENVPRPVGRSWFERVIINVVLPWYYLYALKRGDQVLRRRLEEQFFSWPCLPGNRRTKKILKQTGMENISFKSAAHQQGAVFLYKNFCKKGYCSKCPLAARLSDRRLAKPFKS